MALHYLTVQDILWINLQVTGKVQHYSYARLEEATFYQYAYGESSSLLPQAARFVAGFTKLHPFDAGNDATGLVATLVFLKLNGQSVKVPDTECASWFQSLQTREADVVAKLELSTCDVEDHGHNGVRETTRKVLDEFTFTVSALTPSGTAA